MSQPLTVGSLNALYPVFEKRFTIWFWLFFTSFVFYSACASGEEAGEAIAHSYVSCSNITAEHLTTLQLYQRGLPLEAALESLPGISRAAQQRVRYIYQLARYNGILNTYADVNTNYARCATKVHQQHGTPAVDLLDYGYYFCAGENKIRFEIILFIDKYHTLEKVLSKTPDSHSDIAMRYFRLVEAKGLLAAFDLTANNLKSCLNNLN